MKLTSQTSNGTGNKNSFQFLRSMGEATLISTRLCLLAQACVKLNHVQAIVNLSNKVWRLLREKSMTLKHRLQTMLQNIT